MRTAPLLVFGCLLLAANPAQGAAYYFLDTGTRALGRGGAFIAGADDLTAMYYNPGALTRLRRGTVTINASGVDQYVLFDRADEEGLPAFEPVNNEAALFLIPSFGFSHTFGLPNTTFALGFFPPYAPDMAYPEDGPQRYGLVDSLVWQTYTTLDVAHRVTPWLSLGAGLSWTLMRAEQELAVAMCGKGAACGDNPAQDVHISLAAWDRLRLTWNAGVLVEPTPWLSIGASVVPPITFHAKGSITADFGEDHIFASVLDGTEFSDQDVVVSVPMPLIARLGVAARPLSNLEIELAGVYEGWHVSDEIRVSDVNLQIDVDPDNVFGVEGPVALTDDIVLKTGYQDAFSVRLGGDWDINDLFSARLGTFYESSGVPKATQGVALVDGPKLGYGVGGSVKPLKGLSVDLAFAQSWLQSREITDSEAHLVELELDLADAQNSAIIDGKVVGNGTFASHITFLSAGLTWSFGKESGPRDEAAQPSAGG